MEYGLGAIATDIVEISVPSLNPYCSGIWSRSGHQDTANVLGVKVLILIVVEYGLGALQR